MIDLPIGVRFTIVIWPWPRLTDHLHLRASLKTSDGTRNKTNKQKKKKNQRFSYSLLRLIVAKDNCLSERCGQCINNRQNNKYWVACYCFNSPWAKGKYCEGRRVQSDVLRSVRFWQRHRHMDNKNYLLPVLAVTEHPNSSLHLSHTGWQFGSWAVWQMLESWDEELENKWMSGWFLT